MTGFEYEYMFELGLNTIKAGIDERYLKYWMMWITNNNEMYVCIWLRYLCI